MKSSHFWFHSGSYALLGHLDVAQEKRGRVGVVIVPPFGWEDVCSYRPLRFMARMLAEMGLPVLRYDLPGTGDSAGDAQDPGLLNAWIQSIGDAASELRTVAGVRHSAVIGVHLGALLAAVAASRGANIQRWILWGAVAKGRTLLRELRAAANVERWESLPDEDAPPQPLPGFTSGGFLIAPETQRSLEELDLSKLSWPQLGRTLILSRDDLPIEETLVAAMRCSATEVEMATGRGYSAIMAAPQEALCPEATTRLIGEFVLRDFPELPRRDAGQFPRFGVATNGKRIGGDYVESVFGIDTSSLGMFGILGEPARDLPRGDSCILYLNPGGVRHIGPNRMWVESARRWAGRGVPSLRLDLQGIGESAGELYLDVPSLYRESLMEQIEIAVDALRSRAGVKRFVVIGLCAGACWGFNAAIRNPDVRAAILLNPSLLDWDPGADRRRMLRNMASGPSHWAELAQLIRGSILRGDLKRAALRVAERLGRKRSDRAGYIQMPFETPFEAWPYFERHQKRVTLVFRETEPLLEELQAAGQLPPASNPWVRCVRVPNGGHTFRPLWAQHIAHSVIDAELTNCAGGIQPALARPDSRTASPKTVHA